MQKVDRFEIRVPAFFATLVVLSLSVSSISFGSSVIEASLASITRIAGVVFSGKVSSIQSDWDKDYKTIVTHVTFTDLDYVKGGRRGNQLTLNLGGGVVGNQGIVVDGQPEFSVGSRYILMCRLDLGSAKNAYVPIVGLYQGFYPVALDSTTGLEVVHDSERRPLAAVRNGHAVVVERHSRPHQKGGIRLYNFHDGLGRPVPDSVVQPARPPETGRASAARANVEVLAKEFDPLTRLTEKEFLNVLRQLVSQR